MGRAVVRPDAPHVDQPSVAEILPGLYRAVLDAVGNLEVLDHRREAARIRTEATEVYSNAWNQNAARRLQLLRDRAARIADGKRRNGRGGILRSLERSAGVGRGTA